MSEKLRSLFPEAKTLSSPDDLDKFDREDMLIAVAGVKKLGRAQVNVRALAITTQSECFLAFDKKRVDLLRRARRPRSRIVKGKDSRGPTRRRSVTLSAR